MIVVSLLKVRRAAVSIPANLAEGKGRGTAAEVARFSRIVLGRSTLLEIADELKLGPATKLTSFESGSPTLRLKYPQTFGRSAASLSYLLQPTTYSLLFDSLYSAG